MKIRGNTEKPLADPALISACEDLARRPRHERRASDADDIAQDACLRALNASPASAIKEPFRYLARIARNVLIDTRRRQAQHAKLFELGFDGDIHVRDHADPERILAGKQDLERAVAAIHALPPRCHEAFVLHRFEGLSYPAIARRMGISASMVEKHVSLALLKIARAVQDEKESVR